MILITKSQTNKIGWQVKASFEITLHSKDLSLLKDVQFFFKGIGNIDIKSKRNVASYRVSDIESIRNVIIPHFNKYPLQSAKSIDFLLWHDCIMLMGNKEHLTESGLERIIGIKAVLNLGLSDKLKLSFPNVKVLTRPLFIISIDE